MVELIGGSGGSPASCAKALSQGKHVVTANRRCASRGAGPRGGNVRPDAGLRGGGRRRDSHHQGAARGTGRQSHRAALRNPERHLQLHPDQDAQRGPGVCRRPQGSAGARLRGSRSQLRRGRRGYRTQVGDPGRHGFRRRGRFSGGQPGGHPPRLCSISACRGLGYRIKLLGIARRTEMGIEQRVHPCMVLLAADRPSTTSTTRWLKAMPSGPRYSRGAARARADCVDPSSPT